MRTEWPDEVPILTADDICRGRKSDGHGRHCLTGWRDEVFGLVVSNEIFVTVSDALTAECGTDLIVDFNDLPTRPAGEIARAWNRAMARLGYVVENPEKVVT